MKTTSKILMLVMAMLLSCSILRADVPETNISGPGDPEPNVYWYFIRIRIDSKKKDFEIVGTGTKLMIGTVRSFSKAVWWGIARRQVAIGPFYSEDEANCSKQYYRKSKDKVVEMPFAEAPRSMAWFEVSFRELKRMGTYEFVRSPAAVTSGPTSQFIDALYEGMSFSRLSVGPFWDYTRAEEAKSIYRQNE